MPSKTSTRKGYAPPKTPIDQPVAHDDRYAPVAWLSGGTGGLEDLTVPSGQLCLVRRPGVEGLMKAGVLHNMDSLSMLVDEKHLKGGNLKVESILQDPQALENLLNVVDRVVTHVVVKPEIRRAPNDVTLRKPGVIYTDMVDVLDKMFIFSFATGGTRDLETFRGELEQSLGSLAVVEDVPDATE